MLLAGEIYALKFHGSLHALQKYLHPQPLYHPSCASLQNPRGTHPLILTAYSQHDSWCRETWERRLPRDVSSPNHAHELFPTASCLPTRFVYQVCLANLHLKEKVLFPHFPLTRQPCHFHVTSLPAFLAPPRIFLHLSNHCCLKKTVEVYPLLSFPQASRTGHEVSSQPPTALPL